jgi:hypothetical protein
MTTLAQSKRVDENRDRSRIGLIRGGELPYPSLTLHSPDAAAVSFEGYLSAFIQIFAKA